MAYTEKSFGAALLSSPGVSFFAMCSKPILSINTGSDSLIVTMALLFRNAKQFPGSISVLSICTEFYTKFELLYRHILIQLEKLPKFPTLCQFLDYNMWACQTDASNYSKVGL
uniref:Uncharacterized protein n=1 Tax=Glossina pallidipes TaxID=7398 RepID=A0A1A9ZG65_GLOPL